MNPTTDSVSERPGRNKTGIRARVVVHPELGRMGNVRDVTLTLEAGELLNAELFADLREAKWLAGRWQSDYNHRRPHSALGYQTPAAFAAKCGRTTVADRAFSREPALADRRASAALRGRVARGFK